MSTRFDTNVTNTQQDRQTDGRADRHRTMAEAVLMHSIARKNCVTLVGLEATVGRDVHIYQ